MNRFLVLALLILAIIAAVSWYMMRTSNTAVEVTPTPEINTQQNAEHLIEVRSENVKNKLDDTRSKVQQDQERYNNALAE